MPLTMPSTAWSRGASSKTMLAALPPNSSVSLLPLPAIARWMSLPTSVEPVNATFLTPGCETTSEPVLPAPVTMLTTPGGSSACIQISAKSIADRGVVSAGLSTTVLPAASAGAVDVHLIGVHDLRKRLLRGRVDRWKVLLAVRLDHAAADEQPVARLDLDVVDRLRRRGVLKRLPGQLGRLLLGDRHQSTVK